MSRPAAYSSGMSAVAATIDGSRTANSLVPATRTVAHSTRWCSGGWTSIVLSWSSMSGSDSCACHTDVASSSQMPREETSRITSPAIVSAATAATSWRRASAATPASVGGRGSASTPAPAVSVAVPATVAATTPATLSARASSSVCNATAPPSTTSTGAPRADACATSTRPTPSSAIARR